MSNIVNVTTIYIDSGTAPLNEDSICRCDISPRTGYENLRIYNTWADNSENQTVEIQQYLFSRKSNIVSGEIPITNKTSIVIKTNGVGGVCVNISIVSTLYIDVSCYPSDSTTAATKHNATTITLTTQPAAQSTTTRVKTTTPTVPVMPPSSMTTGNQTEGTNSLSISTSHHSKTDKDDENSFIGPVAGAVGGAVVLIVAVIIIVLCKRKRILNKKKSTDNNTLPTISAHNVAEDHYFDMTENPMYDSTDLHRDDIHETKRTNTQYQNIEANNGRIVAKGKTEIYVNNNNNNANSIHFANTEETSRHINTLVQSDTDLPQYAVVQRRNKP